MLLQQASQFVFVELKGSAMKEKICQTVGLPVLFSYFHCEEQRGNNEYNLSDVKCSMLWNLLGSGSDPDEL